MTNKKVVETEAIVESTTSAVSEQATHQKGDYTKYFYKNINRLWDAVEQLQKEMEAVEERRMRAKSTLLEVL